MIVYNITIKVGWQIHEQWLAWMRGEHIPAMLATGQFDSCKLYRLMDQDETEGPTFVAQYATTSIDRYEKYIIGFSQLLQAEGRSKWGDQFIAFRTLMSLLDAV